MFGRVMPFGRNSSGMLLWLFEYYGVYIVVFLFFCCVLGREPPCFYDILVCAMGGEGGGGYAIFVDSNLQDCPYVV